MRRFNVRAYAITCGCLFGVTLFVLAWWAMLFDGQSSSAPMSLDVLYRGYSTTPLGSVIGLIWGVVDGLIFGAIFAWFYNRMASMFDRSSTTGEARRSEIAASSRT